MKNTIRLLGIIALVAVIGFTMTACGGDGGGGEGKQISGTVKTNWNAETNFYYQSSDGRDLPDKSTMLPECTITVTHSGGYTDSFTLPIINEYYDGTSSIIYYRTIHDGQNKRIKWTAKVETGSLHRWEPDEGSHNSVHLVWSEK